MGSAASSTAAQNQTCLLRAGNGRIPAIGGSHADGPVDVSAASMQLLSLDVVGTAGDVSMRMLLSLRVSLCKFAICLQVEVSVRKRASVPKCMQSSHLPSI